MYRSTRCIVLDIAGNSCTLDLGGMYSAGGDAGVNIDCDD